jgi:glycosyltransferase involved in cell wall biosynthesis
VTHEGDLAHHDGPPGIGTALPARGHHSSEVIMVAGRDPRDGKGGHASYVLAHVLAAHRAGFEPRVFFPGATAAVAESEFGTVHQVRSVVFGPDPANGLWKQLVALTAPAVSAAVGRFLAGRPGPHLVHGFGTYAYVGVVTARRLVRAGLRAVALSSVYTPVEHEYASRARGIDPAHGLWMRARYRTELWWARWFVARCERLAHQRSQLVAVNYESSRRLFLAAYGPGAPSRKLPYASKAAFADDGRGARLEGAPSGVPAGPAPLIVSVSRHDPRKGLDVLLHALADLRIRGVPFRACLTSSGPLLSAHRRLASRLGLDGVTVLTGWVPDPFPYLRAADVFVLPSLQEGSGSLALLEALQAGCAVVASDIDGVPEDVVHGESALLVPSSDAAALGRALEAVLVDAGLRTRLARAARATFETRFSADVFAAAIRDVYADLGVRPPRST